MSTKEKAARDGSPPSGERVSFITHVLENGIGFRNPRQDSVLAKMPTPQRVQLIIWLLDEGCSYRRAKQRLLEVHGVETTTYALSHFFHRFCEPVRLLRIAARVASKANGAAAKSGEATASKPARQ